MPVGRKFREKITRWIEFENSLERGQTSTWSSTRKKAESNFFVKEKFSYENWYFYQSAASLLI